MTNLGFSWGASPAPSPVRAASVWADYVAMGFVGLIAQWHFCWRVGPADIEMQNAVRPVDDRATTENDRWPLGL
jgi:hypothetical protein